MKCCNEIEFLGCFDSCKTAIETKLIANVSGNWSIEIDYMGITDKKTLVVDESELPKEINIVNDLNEDYEYIMRIYAPDGTLLNNKCYSFKIYKVSCN